MTKLKINKIEHNIDTLLIFASFKTKQSQCPICGKYSTSVHDNYTRKIHDLPVFENKTLVLLKTRKFKCKNDQCDRKVFSEQGIDFKRYSRKSVRVSNILDSLSIELTGRQGSLMSKQLSIYASPSTMTRIAHSQELPELQQPKVLGVDDWAYRKGVNYGTILIDMETSRPVDLLKSRENANLKEWLTKYPDVRIVTRDRAGSYSSAINEVCPDAIQIADRFHLLMNLSDALDRYFKSVRPQIRLLIKSKLEEIETISDIDNSCNGKENNKSGIFTEVKEFDQINNDQRIDTFLKVKEMQAKATCISRISKDLGISRNTVRSYLVQESLSPRICPKPTNINVFTNYILNRLKSTDCKIKEIINEIKDLGFCGSQSQAYHNINLLKSMYQINPDRFADVQPRTNKFIKPLSSRKLAKYIGCNRKITMHSFR